MTPDGDPVAGTGPTSTGDRPVAPGVGERERGADGAVELTADGYLRVPAALARHCFPTDALVAMVNGAELWLLPLIGPQSGGLLLKQRNPQGDRSTLVREVLGDGHPVGILPARWDRSNGALRVHLGI